MSKRAEPSRKPERRAPFVERGEDAILYGTAPLSRAVRGSDYAEIRDPKLTTRCRPSLPLTKARWARGGRTKERRRRNRKMRSRAVARGSQLTPRVPSRRTSIPSSIHPRARRDVPWFRSRSPIRDGRSFGPAARLRGIRGDRERDSESLQDLFAGISRGNFNQIRNRVALKLGDNSARVGRQPSISVANPGRIPCRDLARGPGKFGEQCGPRSPPTQVRPGYLNPTAGQSCAGPEILRGPATRAK
ncbi:hypothetical protein KM043_000939 [Ampulex compressa]|nr:hypothetical protein KM043_000939 [Ampulex compressa]